MLNIIQQESEMHLLIDVWFCTHSLFGAEAQAFYFFRCCNFPVYDLGYI